MASPGYRPCANCVGALLFPMGGAGINFAGKSVLDVLVGSYRSDICRFRAVISSAPYQFRQHMKTHSFRA